MVGEFLRIARSTLLFSDFLPKTRELIHRLKKQGAVQQTSIRHLRKIIQRHQDDFSHFRIETEEMLSQIFDWGNLTPETFFFSPLFLYPTWWVTHLGMYLSAHYSGRPQVYTTYACGFTANKVSIKRSLNLSHNSQYHVCIMTFSEVM